MTDGRDEAWEGISLFTSPLSVTDVITPCPLFYDGDDNYVSDNIRWNTYI